MWGNVFIFQFEVRFSYHGGHREQAEYLSLREWVLISHTDAGDSETRHEQPSNWTEQSSLSSPSSSSNDNDDDDTRSTASEAIEQLCKELDVDPYGPPKTLYRYIQASKNSSSYL